MSDSVGVRKGRTPSVQYIRTVATDMGQRKGLESSATKVVARCQAPRDSCFWYNGVGVKANVYQIDEIR